MQFQITTDYAIRIISYLYQYKGQLCRAREMSDSLGITYKYFMKVINRLKHSGLVQSVQGCNGGYMLDSKSEDVTIYDIICAMEGEIRLNRCLEDDEFCSNCNEPQTCTFNRLFHGVQQELIATLMSKKIKDYVA